MRRAIVRARTGLCFLRESIHPSDPDKLEIGGEVKMGIDDIRQEIARLSVSCHALIATGIALRARRTARRRSRSPGQAR
jgi:hypothetical protein